MKKNLTLFLVSLLLISYGAGAQNQIRTSNDLRRVEQLKKYVETHSLREGCTSAAIERLRRLKPELDAIYSGRHAPLSASRQPVHTSSVPVNDDCANATWLLQQSTCVDTTIDLAGATESFPADSCNFNISPDSYDVWFRFLATTASPIITVAGSSQFDAVVFLFDSCGGSILDCSDNSFDGGTEQINASVIPGNTYLIRVYNYGTGFPTTTTFDICIHDTPVPPVNDECSAAILLAENASCISSTFDAANASQSLPPDMCNSAMSASAADVWFKFAAVTSSPSIVVTGSSGYDPVVFLYDSCGGSILDCSDGSIVGGTEVISASGLTVGDTFYVRVYNFDLGPAPTTTTFDICIFSNSAAPSNDSMCNAITLIMNGNAETGNTAYTTAIEYPADSIVQAAGYTCSTPDHTMWYTYTTATADSFNIILTADSNYAFLLGVFTSDSTSVPCAGNITYVDCLPGAASNGSPDTVSLSFTPSGTGVTYLFMVDGAGITGPFSIRLSGITTLNVPALQNTRQVSVYPNPSSGLLQVDFGKSAVRSSLKLYDLVGNSVKENSALNTKQAVFDASRVEAGIYFLKVENEYGLITKKIILTR